MSNSLALPLRRVCQSLERETFRSMPDRQLLEQFAAGNATAFAAIVERHGPLVRAVCRRTVRDETLADDAFQAVFVLLARKSRSLRRPEALAGWLFGAARQIAWRTRRGEARLRHREQTAALQRPEAAEPRPWDDLLQVLDEELDRLPQRLRAPLVACYLQGRTQDEAARELGWPLITLRRRLAAGRERLRLRMDRRGATLSAGLLAAALTPDAGISGSLAEATLTHSVAALHGDAIPAAIAELARERAFGSIGVAKLWLVPMVAACALVGVGMFKPWSQQPLKAMPADKPSEKPKEVLRDRFNDPLPEGALARLGTISLSHGAGLVKLAFTPDSKTLVSLGDIVRFWDVATRHESGQFGEMGFDGKQIQSAAMTPDGKSIVLARGSNIQVTVSIWDAATQKLQRSFETPERGQGTSNGSQQFRFSGDGRFLAETDSHNELHIWDVFAGVEKYKFGPFEGNIRGLLFSADASKLIVVESKQKVHVIDMTSGKEVSTFGGGTGFAAQQALSRDGRYLAISIREGNTPNDVDDTIVVWDVPAGKEIRRLKPKAVVLQFAFAPDGKSLLTLDFGPGGGANLRWDLATGTSAKDWMADALYPSWLTDECYAFSPDGKLLAVGQMNGVIRLWDLQSKKEVLARPETNAVTRMLAYSPDGQRIITGTSRVWDANSGRMLQAKKDNNFGSISRDSRYGYSLTWKNQKISGYYRIDRETGDRGKDLKVPPELRSYQWAIGPGDRWYGILADPETPRIWDAETGEELTLDAARKLSPKWKAPFAVDGKTFIHWLGPKLIALDVATLKQAFAWDYEKKGLLRTANREESVYQAALSPDGKLVAIHIHTHDNRRQGIDPDWCWQRIVLCEAPSGKILHTIRFLTGGATSLKFSPDSKLLAAGTRAPDFPVCIWDVKSGEKLRSFAGHRGQVDSLAFRQDGRRLASGSADGTVLIWDLTGK